MPLSLDWTPCTPGGESILDEGQALQCEGSQTPQQKLGVEALHKFSHLACTVQLVNRHVEPARLVAVRNVDWQRGEGLACPFEAACDRMLNLRGPKLAEACAEHSRNVAWKRRHTVAEEGGVEVPDRVEWELRGS